MVVGRTGLNLRVHPRAVSDIEFGRGRRERIETSSTSNHSLSLLETVQILRNSLVVLLVLV